MCRADGYLWEYRRCFMQDLGLDVSESIISNGCKLLDLTVKKKTRQVMLHACAVPQHACGGRCVCGEGHCVPALPCQVLRWQFPRGREEASPER